MLNKKVYYTPYPRCVASSDTDRILAELHEGYATCHEGPKPIIKVRVLLDNYSGVRDDIGLDIEFSKGIPHKI